MSSAQVGRPTKYKPEYCKELIEHMAQGNSYETFIPKDQYVCTKTLYDWEKKHPEFLQAKREAFKRCQLWWETLGRGMAAGKLKNGNSSVWIFNMKNRFNWSDKTDVSIDFEPEPLEISVRNEG